MAQRLQVVEPGNGQGTAHRLRRQGLVHLAPDDLAEKFAPADAKLSIEGQPTRATGPVRELLSDEAAVARAAREVEVARAVAAGQSISPSRGSSLSKGGRRGRPGTIPGAACSTFSAKRLDGA